MLDRRRKRSSGFMARWKRAPVLLSTLVVLSCLSDPPVYQDSERLPPFIVADKTEPPPWVFVRLAEGETLNITLWFYSEDLGDDLRALTYVDIAPGDPAAVAGEVNEIQASTYDQIRSVELEVAELDLGCHAVTVVLTHQSNLRGNTVLDKDRAARVTWWVDVRGAGGSNLVDDCPMLGVME